MGLLKQPIARYIALASTVFLVVAHYLNMDGERTAAKHYFARAAETKAEQIGDRVDAAFKVMHATLSDVATAAGQMPPSASGTGATPLYAKLAQTLVDTMHKTLPVAQVHVSAVDASPRTNSQPLLTLAPSRSDRRKNSTDNAVFRRIKTHQKWFGDQLPTRPAEPAGPLPMLGATSLSATTGSKHIGSSEDQHQARLLFSVPYFGADGELAGTVSAVVRSEALRDLLPARHYALLNVRYGYVTPTDTQGQVTRSSRWIEVGAPDPKLIASSVIDLHAFDPRSKWRLWSGLPNRAYYNSSAEHTISLLESGGYLALVLLLLVLLFIQWLEVARNKAQRATEMAEKTRHAHEKTLEAEREARRLNEELKANMQKLSDTQLELVKSERLAALGQVTATLSHEIRNPLGAIRSSLYIIRQAALKAELKLDRPLDRIERSVSRCDNLIGDFLEYTRTNTLSFQTVDASEFLTAVIEEQTLADGIEIVCDFPSTGIAIEIDPDRFRRVVINLVDNAAQAITGDRDTGGEIRVSCRVEDKGPVIRVTDNGPGIPDDVLEKIFEPLFTTKSFGAGLGLATVKQLIEQHGADLTIETECGVGTTFTVQLKAVAATAANTNISTLEEKAA